MPISIAPHRVLDYVEEAEARARVNQSRHMTVANEVVEYLCSQWRAGCATVDAIAAAARRVTLGNCASAGGDLDILEHLAARAVEAGLIDGLHPSIQAKIIAAQDVVSNGA